MVVLARFLKGAQVLAVWCEFFNENNKTWSKSRVLLATETTLTAEEVVCLYARRWGIETLFFNLKR
jgi:IS4 transposase